MSQDYDRWEERRHSSESYTPSHLEGKRGRAAPRRLSQEEPSYQPSAQERTSGKAAPKPRRKKAVSFFSVLLYLTFVLGLSALLAGVGWVMANDVLALNKAPLEATVEVGEQDSLDDVAATLKEKGLIEFPLVFKLFVSFTHAKEDITPGAYELNTDMDYRAIVTSISKNSSNRSEVEVTITEGMTLDQIFKLLEEKGVSTRTKLQEVASNHVFKYSFLKDLPTGDYHRLEGYLFPDTYHFYVGGDPLQVLNKMILRFDEKFTDDMRADAQEMGYSVAQIVTIASMIEKETDGSDQKDIASVVYNRLNNPNRGTNGMLQIDATIAYRTGRNVTLEDTQQFDDPYNTYLYPGLPPGAISNPGIVAIRAALYPNSTKYYYYALGDDGTHSFFRTYDSLKAFMNTQALYTGGED